MKWRAWLLITGFVGLFGALLFHLYGLQIQEGDFYTARAASQNRSLQRLEARRGSIYFSDKAGNPVLAATTKKYQLVYAVPKDIKDPLSVATVLESFVGIPKADLERSLSKPNDAYELIVRRATEELVRNIEAQKLEGIYSGTEDSRFYPLRELAAQVIGFIAPTRNEDQFRGRYGIEAQFEAKLSGKPGKIESDRVTSPTNGEDVYLTIDRIIQARSEEILKGLIERHGATGGSVLVTEPVTGRIIALANAPGFDPNEYSRSPVSHFINPAVQNVFEPGSIMKVITMAAGIESGAITPETAVVDTGSFTADGRTIRNWDEKANGRVTATDVITGSINVGAALIEKKIGHGTFLSFLKHFGFEEVTGVALPGEVRGSLKSLESGARDINFATASFGQGIAVTPIELVTAVGALANRGVMMKPLILRDEKPTELARPVSSETAEQVTDMMIAAVQKAEIARIPGYRVAGKTGTAQIPGRGGYTSEFTHSYVGFAPASNPRFLILIKLDRPQGAPLAGLTVVPAFRELAQFIMNYYAIPPDDFQAQSAAGSRQ